MGDRGLDGTDGQLRAGTYARLSETYDAAESVPTQLERADAHAARRGWAVVARFKDDGFSGFKEITRDGFGDLTAECAAALTAMLDALGKKAGPEDTRTTSQRHHDALEEAWR